MKKIFSIIALALIVAACGGSTTTEANDSTVVADTVTVQSVNPGVEGQVPTDSVK